MKNRLKKIFYQVNILMMVLSSLTGVMPSQVTYANSHNVTTSQVEQRTQKSSEEKSIQEATKGNTTPEEALPRVGDINVDLDISPVVSTVSSGDDAIFYLQFKVTGSQTEYNNSKIVVDIPKGAEISGTLSDMSIADVIPEQVNDQLVWDMKKVQSGQAYVTKIRLKTVNGTTANGTKVPVTANFESSDFTGNAKSEAIVTVNASSTLTSTKKYKETLDSDGEVKKDPPTAGDTGVWNITVSADSQEKGYLYFKDGSKIIIKDTLPAGMSYVSDNGGGKYDEASRTITWEFDAPSLSVQEVASGQVFDQSIDVKVAFDKDIENFQQFKNTVNVTGTDITDKKISHSSSASVTAAAKDPNGVNTSGIYWVPTHYGPTDGIGSISTALDNVNPDPLVYDSGVLGFSISTPVNRADHPTKALTKYEINYTIDSHLNLSYIQAPNYKYSPNSVKNDLGESVWDEHLLVGDEHPIMDIYVTIDGKEQKIVTDAEDRKVYRLTDYGIAAGTHVESIRYSYRYAPAGMSVKQAIRTYFSIEPNYSGRVINRVVYDIEGYDHSDKLVTNAAGTVEDAINPEKNTGERYAEVVKAPQEEKIIAKSTIKFENSNSGIVTPGENRVVGKFSNTSASGASMNGPLESMVLLPKGVLLNKDNPEYQFSNSSNLLDPVDSNLYGSAKVVSENYSDTGRQLIKVQYTSPMFAPGQGGTYKFNVIIEEDAVSPLHMDMWGFSGDDELTVPTGASKLTDSYLETDKEDLNGDGNTTQKRVLSSNEYTMIKTNSIKTTKLVKGDQDSEYSKLGHASLGGTIDYQLAMTNNGAKVGTFTLMEVLPSVGDLGITDNVVRNSRFTPTLTGAVTLPESWAGKATVKYSPATNPSRKDLDKNVIYPGTTEHLKDPAGAQTPDWKTAEQVTDWSQIHSFIIEMEGADWVSGEEVVFNFSMKTPEQLDKDLLNYLTPTSDRATWNSFAYTANNLQVVEPERVGAVVNALGNVLLTKVDNKTKEALTGAEFELQDSNGKVLQTGLTTDSKGEILIKDLEPGNYKLIETKAPENYDLDSTPVEFTIESGQTEVLQVTKENTMIPGNVKLTKVDDFSQLLEGAIFDLQDKEGNILQKDLTTDEDGQIYVKGLAPGQYQFVETKAPNGYELDTTPHKFIIKPGQTKDVSLQVTNHLKDFELLLNKVDAASEKAIKGAKFEITDTLNGTELGDSLATGISDSDGRIQFTPALQLKPGETYYLKETEAPRGYKVLTGYFIIEIEDDGSKVIVKYIGEEDIKDFNYDFALQEDDQLNSINFSIPNKRDVVLPDTGSNMVLYSIIMGSVLLSVTVIYLYRKKFIIHK
ncbi:MAG TPA: hypothetical protein DG753_00670 [Clostridium sp.]|nr:hypothetical protein [Clostridium sp.]